MCSTKCSTKCFIKCSTKRPKKFPKKFLKKRLKQLLETFPRTIRETSGASRLMAAAVPSGYGVENKTAELIEAQYFR